MNLRVAMGCRWKWLPERVKSHAPLAGALFLGSILFSCGGDVTRPPAPPVAAAIITVSGDAQLGIIGKPTMRPLATPLRIRVTSTDGRVMPGASISFTTLNGGTLSPASTITNGAGEAEAVWALGSSDTVQTATAAVAGLVGPSATFRATGAAMPVTRLTISTGPASGSTLIAGAPVPLVVSAFDADGDPALSFSGTLSAAVLPSGGGLSGTTTVTAVKGVATFAPMSVTKAGSGYVLQVTSTNLASVATASFSVVAGPVAALVVVSGPGQTVAVGGTVNPVTVVATDANGNPKEGVTVLFKALGYGGAATPDRAVTAPDGRASTAWTVKYYGSEDNLAISTSGAPAVSVGLRLVTPVHHWVITQQPARVQAAGVPITPVLTAELRDSVNHLVPISSVDLLRPYLTSGYRAVSLGDGVVSFPGLTIDTVGTNVVLGLYGGDAPTLGARPFDVTPASRSMLRVVSGTEQAGVIGQALAQPVVARVSDRTGSPIAGVTVAFAPTGTSGAVAPVNVITDLDGKAATVWTLGQSLGTQVLSVASADVDPTTATATATATAPATSADASVRLAAASYRLPSYYQVPPSPENEVHTEVLLPAPAPAGGTGIAFALGTPGIVTLTPERLVIPQGQTAGNVIIRSAGVGSTTITPLANGNAGRSSGIIVASLPPIPRATALVGLANTQIGVGQFDQFGVRTPDFSPASITVTSANPRIVSVTPIQGTSVYRIDGVSTGQTTLVANAPGWSPESATVTVTSLRSRLCCEQTLTSPDVYFATVYITDSARLAHPLSSPLTVHATSSNSAIIKVLDTTVTIGEGVFSAPVRVTSGATVGEAWLVTSGIGLLPDSLKFTTSSSSVGLGLRFQLTSSSVRLVPVLVGEGQVESQLAVMLRSPDPLPVVATLSSADPSILTADERVTIPPREGGIFSVVARSLGSVRLVASASGYAPDSLTFRITRPRLVLRKPSSIVALSSGFTNVTVADSAGTVHNRFSALTVSLRSSDTTVLAVDSSVGIPAGSYFAPGGVKVTAKRGGRATIYATAPGHGTDSSTWTVTPARLSLSWRTYTIGATQVSQAGEFYVALPGLRDIPVPVTLTDMRSGIVVRDTVAPVVAAGSLYASFGLRALATGADTIIASAVGYAPDTAVVVVSTPQLGLSGLPSSVTIGAAPTTVVVYAADSTRRPHTASSDVLLSAVSSDPNVLVPGEASVVIRAGSYYATTTVRYVGVGTASIMYRGTTAGYAPVTSNAVTVSVASSQPSLAIRGASPLVLGTGQHTAPLGYYIYLPNVVSAPLTVNFVSTDPRVASVPAAVTIATGSYYAYFRVTAQDTLGSVLVQASAPGYGAATIPVRVTTPRFVTDPRQGFRILAADANGTVQYVNKDVVVSLTSSDPLIAKLVDTTVTIPADNYASQEVRWSPVSPGPFSIRAADNRPVLFPYASTVVSQEVAVPSPPPTLKLGLTAANLGVGQYVVTYAELPSSLSFPKRIALSHTAASVTTTPTEISTGSYGRTAGFRILATSTGVDTITATWRYSPPGCCPPPVDVNAQTVVSVTAGRVDPIGNWPTSLRVGDSVKVTLFTRAGDQSTQYVAAATTFTLSPNAALQFVSGVPGSAALTAITVPQDEFAVSFYIKAMTAGTGSATIGNASYTTYSNTVTVTP